MYIWCFCFVFHVTLIVQNYIKIWTHESETGSEDDGLLDASEDDFFLNGSSSDEADADDELSATVQGTFLWLLLKF